MLDRIIIALFGMGSLSACTLSVPQVERLYESASAAFTKKSSQDDDNIWTAETNAQGRVVSLYQRDGMFVFVSEEQDFIAFDGWVVRSVSGFGLPSTKDIIDENGLRTFVSRGGSTGGSVKCGAWRPDQTDVTLYWRQTCAQLSEDNVITVDATGNVVSIRQVIGSQGEELVLKRVSWQKRGGL